MPYFEQQEPEGGPYFDLEGKYISHDMEDEFYKKGMMNPSSKKDYELHKEAVSETTKRFVGLVKAIRNSQDHYNF